MCRGGFRGGSLLRPQGFDPLSTQRAQEWLFGFILLVWSRDKTSLDAWSRLFSKKEHARDSNLRLVVGIRIRSLQTNWPGFDCNIEK